MPRQSVDVLRGTMLRLGANQGLLVTTSGFSPAAVEATQAAQHVAPVRLIDSCELAMLLLRHNILPEQGSGNEGSAANAIKDAVAPAYPAADVAKERPPVRAVPNAPSAPAGGGTPNTAKGEQPPTVTTAAKTPLPLPQMPRRGIAITIVLSPLSGNADKSYPEQTRS